MLSWPEIEEYVPGESYVCQGSGSEFDVTEHIEDNLKDGWPKLWEFLESHASQVQAEPTCLRR